MQQNSWIDGTELVTGGAVACASNTRNCPCRWTGSVSMLKELPEQQRSCTVRHAALRVAFLESEGFVGIPQQP